MGNKTKRLLGVALVVLLLVCILPLSIAASETAATPADVLAGDQQANKESSYPVYIGEQGYDTLAAAISAAQNEAIIEIREDGAYSLPSFAKTLTIQAAEGVQADFALKANSVLTCKANVTFKNVSLTFAVDSHYGGLQFASLVYENCTINGQAFLYGGSEIFNNCTFNTTDANYYNVWTYGASNVTFNNCTFNCAGKSIFVYSEGYCGTVVNVNNCKLIASAPVAGKAAVEIDSSLLKVAQNQKYTIVIDAATTVTGFGQGNVSGNSLWNNKKGELAEVTVNGEKVLKIGSIEVEKDASEIVTGAEGTAAEAIILQLQTNTAVTEKEPENVPQDAELVVELTGITVDNNVATKIVFEVAPMKDDQKVENLTEKIVFRLPIPASVTADYAKVFHEDEMMGVYAIQGTGANRYVEIASAEFSTYAMEPVTTKSPVYIGTTGYDSLQAAVNAVQDGQTITLNPEYSEFGYVYFIEDSNKKFTIDGQGATYAYNDAEEATIEMRGDARDLVPIVTIRNIHFTTTKTTHDFIQSNEKNRYPNLLIEDCTFTGPTNATGVVAVRLKSSESTVIRNCSATNVHSFLQNDAGWNLTVEGIQVTAISGGMSLGSVQNALIKSVTVVSTKDDGYGIRLDGSYATNVTIENATLTTKGVPVYVRNLKDGEGNWTLKMNGTNTLVSQSGLKKIVLNNEKEYADWTAPTKRAIVILNDSTLTGDDVQCWVSNSGNEYYTLKTEAAVISSGHTTYHGTLAEAIAAAAAGDTVKLLADITGPVTLDKAITLDLNGYSVAATGVDNNDYAIKVTASGVKITGTAAITDADTVVSNGNGFALLVEDNASVELSNVEVIGHNAGIKAYGDVTVNDGTYITATKTTEGCGDGIRAYGDAVITVNGGEIKTAENGTKGYAIEVYQTAKAVINDGAVTGKTGICVYGGALEVKGGTVTGTSEYGLCTTSWGDDSIIGKGEVTISGGEINGKIVVEKDDNGTLPAGYSASIAISGGTVNGELEVQETASIYSMAVSGGSFDRAVPEAYFADGYITKENADGTYYMKLGAYTAQVGDKKHETLAEAMEAAAAGDTVKLLADITGPVTLDKAITLDLNGYSVAATGVDNNDYAIKVTASGVKITGTAAITDADTVVSNGNGFALLVEDNASVELSNVEVIGHNAGIKAYGDVTVNDGTYITATKTTEGCGDGIRAYGDAVITVNGGEIKTAENGTKGYAIEVYQTAKAVINDGAVTGKTGICVYGGALEVKGGTVTGTSEYGLCTTSWGDDSIIGKGEVTISGGEINGKIVVEKDDNGTLPAGYSASIAISGGTVNGELEVQETASIYSMAVSGGSFKNVVPEAYCAAGFSPVTTANAEGKYEVKLGYILNAATGKNYNTLQDALNAANTNDVLQLLQAVTENAVAVTKGVTLDLNGFTLTADYFVAFAGTDVTDSTGNGLLKCSETQLASDNTYMPVWDNAAGGYRLFPVVSRQFYYPQHEDGFTFYAKPFLGSAANNALMTQDGGTGLEFKICMRWTNSGNTVEQFFAYTDDQVKAAYAPYDSSASNEPFFYLNVTGARPYKDNLKTTCYIKSETGVVWQVVGETFTGAQN